MASNAYLWLVCDLNRTPNCYGKTWRFLCPFFRNLHLRENLARDCFTSTVSTVTNSVQNIFTHPRYCDKYTVATFNNNLVWFTGAIYFVVENLTTFNQTSEFLCVLRPSCVVDGSAFSLDCFTLLLARHLADRDVKQTTFSFADGPVVCSTSLMASLIIKHETSARCRASRSVKQSSGLQKDYKFKFKYLIASYTWQGVYRGSCNKVSHMKT